MEIWRDIIWYEWLYQASTFGRIKSLDYGRWKKWKPKIMKLQKSKYLMVKLCKDWLQKRFSVHRLVWLTFLKHEKETINHKDWNKFNNNIENLEWATLSENLKHKYRVLWYKNHFHYNHPYKWKFWKDHPKYIE